MLTRFCIEQACQNTTSQRRTLADEYNKNNNNNNNNNNKKKNQVNIYSAVIVTEALRSLGSPISISITPETTNVRPKG